MLYESGRRAFRRLLGTRPGTPLQRLPQMQPGSTLDAWLHAAAP